MACKTEQLKHTDHASDIDFATPLTNKYKPLQGKGTGNAMQSNEESTAHENKLPINLFYSAAEYNKMLITNGRSLRKRSEPQMHVQDYGDGLEFINDGVFQSCEQKRESMRQRNQQNSSGAAKEKGVSRGSINFSDRKNPKTNSNGTNCGCCCCDEYCRVCVREQQLKQKVQPISQYQLEKALEKIKSQPIKSKTKPHTQKPRKKVITSEAIIKSQLPQSKRPIRNVQNSQKECSSSYLSHKSFNIDNLLYKSLLQFEQSKRQNKLKHIYEKRQKIQHQNLMKEYEEAIRERNKGFVGRTRPVGKRNKSASNYNIRNGYWQSIKEGVAKELEKERRESSKTKKNDGKMSKSAVNCTHEVKIPAEMIEILRVQRERQAKQKIAKEAYIAHEKKRKIEKHLEQLERNRRHHINSCEKKKFNPSPQMIEQAFKNIIEEKKADEGQHKHKPTMKKIKS